MGKKENKPVNLYPKEDYEQMVALWKKIITTDDVDSIYKLFKKYVDPHAPYPIIGCGACELSVSKYYDRLRDWWYQNKELFL